MSSSPLAFRLPSGSDVHVRALAAEGSGDALRLTVEADPEVWETIDLVELFHLGLAVRGPGSVSGERPVQIELRPAPAIRDRVASMAGDDGDRLIDALARLDEGDDLLGVEHWYATEVTEAVELPPELADKGELREGFRTAHADGVPD